MTDWRSEIELRLAKSLIYQTFIEKATAEGDAIKGQVTSIVYDGVKDAYEKSKLILKYMPEYTLHDGEHLFRVLYNMEKIISKERVALLSVPDLMLLMLSAFFHDLGMAPYEDEIKAWKEDWENDIPTEEEEELFGQFKRFKQTYPDKLDEINRLKELKKDAKANLLHDHLISEYIRTTHAVRAKEIIGRDWAGRIRYRDADLTHELAQLCFSHNEDSMELLKFDQAYPCGEDIVTNLQFIGVVLRLADLLDFDAKRTPSVLFSHLAVRNSISLEEWQKHRAMQAWKITPNDIIFSAKCKHPAIEASIRKFCDYIDDELKNCGIIIGKMPEQNAGKTNPYKIDLAVRVTRDKIEAEKDIVSGEPIYYYENTSFELNKNQVIELLMGTKLYGNPDVALRELLQNSRDACKLSMSLHEKWGVPYVPEITVKYYTYEGEDYLEVLDNGIGMNKEIIDKYYSKIGSSFYKSRDFYELKAKSEIDFIPISEFGIGILSCFMIADTIEVETKRLKEQFDYDKPLKIIIEGHDSIFTIIKSDKKVPGTNTKLLLREKNPWEKMTESEFIQAVKNVFPNPPFQVNIETDKEKLSYTPADFTRRHADELKDYSWGNEDYIREIKISLNEDGFQGDVLVAILEKDAAPVSIINKLSKEVEVEGTTFDLSLEITIGENEIKKTSKAIDIDDEGNVRSTSRTSALARSRSRFSIHGITYAGSFFPDYYSRDKKAMLKWCIPFLIILDLQGSSGLDLNSARNEIIYNEKWNKFEENLAFLLCKGLQAQLDVSYWKQLVELFKEKSKSENFLAGLNRSLEWNIASA
ncbi:metal-dependent phosphohydrolase [Chitinophaga sp. SYP-B3965]|uniref:HD domain-containing protein n=1 Tax=Chitinophaga sp. SYP-B3965 TaxID=2663120 RepID=UPI001299933E|nr:ATP-binding protein [Chitinophaga sp. SYP-B3965]MRG45691.1 metal-dependent phosphohydrolase [Chitinophaga sp. SYP-B3965]